MPSQNNSNIIKPTNKHFLLPFILLTLSCIFTLAGFFSQYGWWFDLASHFRLQYLLIQILCIVLCVYQKRNKLLFVTALFALINLTLIAPYYFPGTNPPTPFLKGSSNNKMTSEPIKILLINVNSPNTNYQAVRNYIKKTAPDILALEEINERWINELTPTLQSYPNFKEVSQENNFGLGLYSRIPLQNMKVEYFASHLIPSLVGGIIWDGQPVSIIFTHPMPPGTVEHFIWHNRQLERIGLLKPHLEENILLIGDLNATSWSYSFQKLIKDLNVKDSREGFGLQTSWPSFLPYLGITIDHCLISKNIFVVERTVGPNVGSDHLPVLIKLSLPQ